MAHKYKDWGVISQLSAEYSISRTFIYMLENTLRESSSIIFGTNNSIPPSIDQKISFNHMLSLRLEGKCSIDAVSTIMKRFDVKTSSTGSISQYLTSFGSSAPNTMTVNNDKDQIVIFLSDEIFSKRTPILVTVDPISSAILKIELSNTRKAEDWKNHWECLEENGYYAAYLVCDEGKGLCTAHKETLSNVFRQPDTYHAIAHQLGQWVNKFETAAYKAIEKEDQCYQNLDSARTDRVIETRFKKYEDAKQACDDKIEFYETFKFLYISTIENLRVFNNKGVLFEKISSLKKITI